MKSTVARATREGGWAVLNADDPLVAAMARRVRAHVAVFSLGCRRRRDGGGPADGRGRRARPTSCATAGWSRSTAARRSAGDPVEHRIIEVERVPITLGGLARHNVANALAAAGAVRGLGITLAQLRDGLADFQPDVRAVARPAQPVPARVADRRSSTSPTTRPGVSAVLDVAEGIAGGAAGPDGAGDRDHRDGRRPAGRHAPRDRPDRRQAGPAGRDQGDAQVPPRPEPRVDRRRDHGRRRVGGPVRRRTSRSTNPRPRRSAPSWPGTARARPGRTRRGSSS